MKHVFREDWIHVFHLCWMLRYVLGAAISTPQYRHRQHPSHCLQALPRIEYHAPRGTVRRQHIRTLVVSKSQHTPEDHTPEGCTGFDNVDSIHQRQHIRRCYIH